MHIDISTLLERLINKFVLSVNTRVSSLGISLQALKLEAFHSITYSGASEHMKCRQVSSNIAQGRKKARIETIQVFNY